MDTFAGRFSWQTAGRPRLSLANADLDGAGQTTGQICLETGDQAEATAVVIFATFERAGEYRDPFPARATTITDHLCLDAALEVLRRVLPETMVSQNFGRSITDRIGGER